MYENNKEAINVLANILVWISVIILAILLFSC